ncbi:MAG: AAA family ATPase [Pontimonas sp.]|nr:AAA family ATPase [Pontimonas sp.]
MRDNLAAALGWYELGLLPFPCYSSDTWVGDNLHLTKSPKTKRGFYDAFRSAEEIRSHWTESPDDLVGVWCQDKVVVLDIDKGSKDGFFSLEDNQVVPPETFSVTTQSGGEHKFYAHPRDFKLGPDTDLVLENGVVLTGVDRRAGNSYFIAWSDKVPKSLDALAAAPGWLCRGRGGPERVPYEGKLSDWIAALTDGAPSPKVIAAMGRIPQDDFDHSAMIRRQSELVLLGVSGEPGVPLALEALKDAWLRGQWDTPQYQLEWSAALAGAIAKFGGLEPQNKTLERQEQEHETKVLKRIEELRVEFDAETRLLAESFRGSQILTLDELHGRKEDYIVESLIPQDAIALLVAKSNMGKTFCYVDLVMSIIYERSWLGKETKRVKTLIVLGEGVHGFHDRLSAWADYWGEDLAIAREWLLFVDGANLNNRASREKIAETVKQFGAGLVILDTWSVTSGLPDENGSTPTSTTLQLLDESIGEASVLIIHHPSKVSESSTAPKARGTSALESRADTVMTLFADKKYHSTTTETKKWISLSTEVEHGGKNRNAPTETIQGMYLEAHDASAVFLRDLGGSIRKRSAIVQVHLNRRMTVKEFSAVIGKSESTARRALEEAVQEGVAIREDFEGASAPSVYSLSMKELVRRAS